MSSNSTHRPMGSSPSTAAVSMPGEVEKHVTRVDVTQGATVSMPDEVEKHVTRVDVTQEAGVSATGEVRTHVTRVDLSQEENSQEHIQNVTRQQHRNQGNRTSQDNPLYIKEKAIAANFLKEKSGLETAHPTTTPNQNPEAHTNQTTESTKPPQEGVPTCPPSEHAHQSTGSDASRATAADDHKLKDKPTEVLNKDVRDHKPGSTTTDNHKDESAIAISTTRMPDPVKDYDSATPFADSPPKGLRNSGNSCYLNAAVQFLLAAKPFRNTFGFDLDRVQKYYKSDTITKALHDLVPRMIYGQHSVDAEAFRKIAGEDHQFFNINQHGQEDCLEYLLHMLSKIEEDFPEGFQRVNPCNKLRIEFCEEVARSGECTDYIHRKEIVLSCPLVYRDTDESPKERQSHSGYSHHYEQLKTVRLEDCITKFMAKEQIISRSEQQIHKMSRIAVFPNYLIVHMRKMKIDQHGRSIKLRVKTVAPNELNLAAWECEESWLKNCSKTDTKNDNLIKDYHLKAFVTHYGHTTYVGHYVCHVKYDNDWYMFNDSQVYEIHKEEIEKYKAHGLFYLYEQKEEAEEKTQL